jgi:hypothetical protein
MLYSIITTIQKPTASVLGLVEKLNEVGGKLIVAGDKKGPADFHPPGTEDGPVEYGSHSTGERGLMADGRLAPGDRRSEIGDQRQQGLLDAGHSSLVSSPKAGSSNWPVEFLSLEDQLAMPFELARLLPVGHYARKNLAYLAAIHQGASCIYETDDDNAPNEQWVVRDEVVANCRVVEADENRWVNVYRYFSKENVWPRGLPLDEIRKEIPEAATDYSAKRAPIQQGLVNGSADVDAIWRLVMDREFFFEPGASVYLEPGNWCPFNTQTTWWWPVAYPLLYIPSYCSFRMCDIWKSFVAQRCLWELDMGIVFHAPEVYQDRNVHDLMRDFRDEIPGYDKNREICEILAGVELKKGETAVSENLLICYEALVQKEIFPFKELDLLKAWVSAV